MAKKKGKTSKNLFLNKLLSYLQIILLFVAIGMIFTPAIVSVSDSTATYTGLEVVFGETFQRTILGIDISYEIFKLSILNLVPYLIILVGIVLVNMQIRRKDNGDVVLDFVLFITFALTGVLFIFVVNFVVPGDGITEIYSFFGEEFSLVDHFKIASGAIISQIALYLTSLISLSKMLLMKKK